MPLRLSVRRLGRGLDAAGLAPVIARDGAWRATLVGLLTYLLWQAAVLAAAAASWWSRVRGSPCVTGPLCGWLADWSDNRVAVVSLWVIVVSVPVLLIVARLAVALARGRFWAGIAARVTGWCTALGGLLLVFVGGWVWLVLGAWTAYWASRLRYDPPAWAVSNDASRPPGPPPEAMVIEGERA